jgi:hypothetical protein
MDGRAPRAVRSHQEFTVQVGWSVSGRARACAIDLLQLRWHNSFWPLPHLFLPVSFCCETPRQISEAKVGRGADVHG